MTIDLLQPFYPHFVPNQVLTNTQLNQLRTYLDQQERLTRIRLVGKGIVCGLTWSMDNNNAITIHEGYGVTSDGYLIELEETTYTGAHPYVDPDVDADGVPEYLPWVKNNEQISIIELIADFVRDTDDEPGDTEDLSEVADLQDRVLVLYLEQEDVDLKSCLVTECDNKGLNIRLNVKALLIPKDIPLDLCDSTPSLVHIPRFHAGLLHIAGPPDRLDEVNTVLHINDTYRRIAQDFRTLLITRVQDAFAQYGPFLGLNPTEIDQMNELTTHLSGGSGSLNQYHYDLVKDVAQAYNEFITCACELIIECCPVSDFPRHLMLGAIDREEGYRHVFMPSPVRNVMHADLEKVTKYFRRMLALVQHFDVSLANEIRITPSHTELVDLGRRAVPYYYGLPQEMQDCWQPRLCCTTASLWSYHAAHVDVNGYGNEALSYDYGRFSFMRIEGHVGQLWHDAHSEIADLRTQHNLEFDLLTLHLIPDAAPGGGGLPQNIQSALEQIEVQMLQVPRIREIRDLYEGLPGGTGDLVGQVRGKLEMSKVQLYDAHDAWMADRCGVAIRCDIAAVQADYLLLRSEVLSLYQRIFTYLDALMDFMDGLAEFLLDDMPQFLDEKGGKERSKIDVVERLKTIENKEASLRLRLKQSDDALLQAKLRNELEVVVAERKHLARLEGIVDRSKIVLEKLRKEANSEVEAGAVEDGDLERRALYGAHLEIALLRDHVHELIHYLLPKDLTCFNYDLFTYRHQRLVQATLELRLWPIFLLWYALASGNRDDLPEPPDIIEGGDEGDGGITTNDSLLEALQALLDGDESYFENVDQDVADLVTLGLQIIGSLPALLQLFSGNYHNSLHARLATQYYLLIAHRQEDVFARFAATHDGMEHTAGVIKGGTFILVCDNNPATTPTARVIADFMLHGRVGCCCDIDVANLCLPPVAVPDYHIVTRPLPGEGGPIPAQAVFNVLWNDYSLNDESQRPYQNEHVSALVLTQVDDTSEQGATLSIFNAQEGTVEYLHNDPEFYGIDAFGYTLADTACDDILATGRIVVLVVPEFVVPPREDTGSIEGTVTDCKTSEPLVGVAVEIHELGVGTLTNNMGHYEISNLEPGDYLVNFEAIGYENTEQNATVSAEDSFSLDICLNAVNVGLGQFIYCFHQIINPIDIFLDGTLASSIDPGQATAFLTMPSESPLIQICEHGGEPAWILEFEADMQVDHLSAFIFTGDAPDNEFHYDLIVHDHGIAQNDEGSDILISFVHGTPNRGRVQVSLWETMDEGNPLLILAEDAEYQDVSQYQPVAPKAFFVQVLTLDSPSEETWFEVPLHEAPAGSAMIWLLCGPEALIGYTPEGERIVWNRVIEEVQVETGDLTVQVTDARSGNGITNAKVRLLKGGKTVAIVEKANQKQVYPFTDVLVGEYGVLVQADGFRNGQLEAITIKSGQTAAAKVSLVPVASAIPLDDALIDNLVEGGSLDPKAAAKRLQDTFDARYAEKMAVLDGVIAEKSDIAQTKTYIEARAFLATDVPDANLSAGQLAERYQDVAERLVSTIKTTTNERRPDYTAMLEAVTQLYLDRIATSQPKEISAEESTQVEAAVALLKEGGVKMASFAEGWSGTTLKEDLGITAVDGIQKMLK